MLTPWLSDKLLLCLINANMLKMKHESTYIRDVLPRTPSQIRLAGFNLILSITGFGYAENTEWTLRGNYKLIFRECREESAGPLINFTELESKSGFYVKTVVETLQPVVWGERANMSRSLWNPNVTKIKTLITGNDLVLFVVFKGWSPASP